MAEINLPSATVSTTNKGHERSQRASIHVRHGKEKRSAPHSRQILSCTKCRERKVKCDRTMPCSACCAHGQPRQCSFVSQGCDYVPMQQSDELRKLRVENIQLKECLRKNEIVGIEDGLERHHSPQVLHTFGVHEAHNHLTWQSRLQSSRLAYSLHFGSPSLATVVSEFARVHVSPVTRQHLKHILPHGTDMYAPEDLPLFPFATIYPDSIEKCIPELLRCLPHKEELFSSLKAFQDRVYPCFFPCIPEELTRRRVDNFLSDHENAYRRPEILALLFAALALGSQHGVWDKYGKQWVAGAVEGENCRGNLYIVASMQTLRLASFMSRPTLLGIQALIMMGPYLTNSGRHLDAWTLFGTTIRQAQSIDLHRHPDYIKPAPSTQKEYKLRQTIWWWLLHMDQEYSMTLGLPLGISGIGDCPPPYKLANNATLSSFSESVQQFTLLARQILRSERLSGSEIDVSTDLLRNLMKRMPEQLQFNTTWLDKETEIPQWPLDAMTAVFHCRILDCLILLNLQRIDKQAPEQSYAPTSSNTPLPSTSPVRPNPSQSSPAISSNSMLRGRALILASSEELLMLFLFFYSRVPAALIWWTVGQQALNASMILICDAFESRNLSRIGKVEEAYVVFAELDRKGVNKLANLAVQRISRGLKELEGMQGIARSERIL